MKALTLIQPWASLIMDGRKIVETRSWNTKYRGALIIHAGSKVDRQACEFFGYDPKKIATSAGLGTVRLIETVQFPSPWVVPDPYGDFAPGRFGWLLCDVRRWRSPSPMPGKLGLWEWNSL